MRGRYGTEQGQQFKGGMAMKGCPFVVAKGAPRTFTYYALKRNREPDEFMEECARQAVAMKTLERIPAGSSPNTSAASIRTWVGWALGLGSRAPLDMRASGTFGSTFREASSNSRGPSVGLRSHRCWSPQRPICIVADVLDDSRAGRAAWNDVPGEG
jgi:hypothetical protein